MLGGVGLRGVGWAGVLHTVVGSDGWVNGVGEWAGSDGGDMGLKDVASYGLGVVCC